MLSNLSGVVVAAAIFVVAGEVLLSGHYQFRATSERVEVPVTVMLDGRAVTGLGISDFQVLEDDKTVQIEDLSVESGPLDITILLDVSESTSLPWIDAHKGLVKSVAEISRLVQAQDILTTYRFSDAIEKADSETSLRQPRGQTAIFDSILQNLLQRQRSPRAMTIVLTDGLDTASVVPRSITRTVAERSDGVVHVIALSLQTSGWYFGNFSSRLGGFTAFSADLRELAASTGGRFFTVDTAEKFLPALKGILDEARTRYYLRYTPHQASEPGWHNLKVLTRGKRYVVTHRRGYWRPL